MYTLTIVHTRPSESVPFFGSSSPEASDLIQQLNAAITAAPGFISKMDGTSDDNLTSTNVYLWESRDAHTAFLQANQELLEVIKVQRAVYYSATGITRTIS